MNKHGPSAASRAADTEENAGRGSKREILDAAARFLRLHGYHATTLRDIATAVGMKAGSLYYHFSSKDEIVAAVMNDGVGHVHRAVENALQALPADAAPSKRLEAAIRAHLGALLELSDYTSAGLKAYGDVPDAVRQVTRPYRRKYEALWGDLIGELVKARVTPAGISPDTMRFAVLGLMNWSPEWYRPGKHSIETLAREFAVLFLR